MKKFALCCLAVALVALFVPVANAAPVTTCYHLTYFCDGVQTTKNAGVVVGLWDFICQGAGAGSLMAGTANSFGTQPIYPFVGGVPAGFDAQFYLRPAKLLFNLAATTDGVTFFYFQKNSPYTPTPGPCNPLGPRNPGRSATGR
jgi:hypothetical protein